MGVCSEPIRVASAKQQQQQTARTPERMWFEAAEAGDIDAMKELLALKPGLITATMRLQVCTRKFGGYDEWCLCVLTRCGGPRLCVSCGISRE